MATTASKTTSTTSKSTSKSTAKTSNTAKAEPKAVVEKEAPKKVLPKDIDVNEIIPVKNGFCGKLVYISPKTGERFVWDELGDVQDIELRELRNIKSSSKRFFEENCFEFDEEYDWVIDYLGVRQYYKNTISIDEFMNLIEKDADTVVGTINGMSKGQKSSFSFYVRQKVLDGEIDSNKLIAALEKALDTELIER